MSEKCIIRNKNKLFRVSFLSANFKLFINLKNDFTRKKKFIGINKNKLIYSLIFKKGRF